MGGEENQDMTGQSAASGKATQNHDHTERDYHSCGHPIYGTPVKSKFKPGLYCSKECVDAMENAGISIT